MYYALRERDVPTRYGSGQMYMVNEGYRAIFYPKNGHALGGPDAEPDLWVNTAIWCNSFF